VICWCVDHVRAFSGILVNLHVLDVICGHFGDNYSNLKGVNCNLVM
jgi:hypothetical protein